MRRARTAMTVAALVALVATACGTPSTSNKQKPTGSDQIGTQQNAIDPTAKGPAPEVPGARKGGTITIYSQATPTTFDPTDVYYTDSNEIAKLLFRTPTQFAMRNHKPVLVPDLTDLGSPSADNLTWTFKMRAGARYADGTAVKIEDLAYAIKRSFAHDIFTAGPSYQLTYFKDGDAYKGPYTGGDNYSGVATPDANTLVIHLARPFSDLPFYMSFPMFSPIPQGKDTRQNYKNNPLATGPYQFDSFTPGTELTLKRNPNWDPKTDPVRHQYPDAWDFKWGQDDVKVQQQVLNSHGPDANAINIGAVDASLIPQLTGKKADQLIRGDAPCTIVVTLDTRKIPLDVRKAIAKAYPYDQTYKAAGLNDYIAQTATTILPPSVPGHTKYPPLPDLTGVGKGDPAGAKAMLQAAGKLGFEVSWYYDNTKPVPQQTSQIRADALKAAGFTVKPIGISTAEVRTKGGDYNAPVNMGQLPAGWCSDWPSGGSWFPVLFESHGVADGQSWGMLTDKTLDAEIEQVSVLPADQATPRWGALDQKIMGMYVALPRYYDKMAVVAGTNIGGGEGDATMGMPLFPNLFLKS